MLLKPDGEEALQHFRATLGDDRVDAALLLITRMERLMVFVELEQTAWDIIADQAFDAGYRCQYLTDKIIIAQIVEKTWVFGEAFRVWRRSSESFMPNNRDSYPYIPLQTLLDTQSCSNLQEYS